MIQPRTCNHLLPVHTHRSSDLALQINLSSLAVAPVPNQNRREAPEMPLSRCSQITPTFFHNAAAPSPCPPTFPIRPTKPQPAAPPIPHQDAQKKKTQRLLVHEQAGSTAARNRMAAAARPLQALGIVLLAAARSNILRPTTVQSSSSPAQLSSC